MDDERNGKCWCGGELGEQVHALYRRCTRCGTACLLGRPGEADLQRFYSVQGYWRDHQVKVSHHPPIEERAVTDFNDRIPVWFAALKRSKPDVRSVLEIGCAHGGFLHYCRERGVRDVVGVEVDEGTCEFARRRFDLPHVVSGLFPRVSLPRDKFDAIVGFDVLEHFLEPVAAMEAVRGLLADDGVFLFQTPWFRGESGDWVQFRPQEHIYLYSAKGARRLMAEAELRVNRLTRGHFPDDMFVGGGRATEVRKLLYVRTDSIGDAVLSAGVLARVAEALPAAAEVAVVCQENVAPFYEPCPHVDRTITYDKARAYADETYRNGVLARVKEFAADVCVAPVYSREPLTDFFAAQSDAIERVAHEGDLTNMPQPVRDANNAQYTSLIFSSGRSELAHHRDLLDQLAVDADALSPQVWTTDADRKSAEETLAAYGLEPGKTIALFAGGQFAVRDYGGFGVALAGVCRERGWKVVALGAPREAEINRRNLEALGGDDVAVDLTGKTSIREAAEIIRLCRLAVGAETSLAHIACAVGVPNVIILGGGHFGRFMPYSPLTTAACLPITCYACNWNCRFTRPHCVTDVSPQVVEAAIRVALDDNPGDKPRVVAQDRSLWQPAPGQPMWGWFHKLLDRASIDLITVGRRSDGTVVTTLLRPPRRHTWGTPPSEVTARRLAAATECLQASPEQLPSAFARQARALASEHALADMPASVDERLVIDEILSGLARGEGDPWALQYRAAAMLYFRMHELAAWDPARIPSWLFDDFVAWTVRQPGLFFEIGEADEYFRRLLAWFELVRAQLRSIPQNDVWRRLAEPMSLLPNLIPAYFTSADMRPLLEARSDIMEMYLRAVGAALALETDPPPPTSKGGRIRIGILKNHWLAGTETYATLPLYEHLPRDRFEVILYVLEEVHDAAEAYCRQRADRFVVLPQAMSDQAVLLRRDNCDVLFYAINMTAVAHPLLPLAMNRLAPVQATSICSPATTGLLNMDVFLAGELTEPREDAQASYREKLVKLPGSGICFDYALRPPPSQYALSRAALNLDDKTVVFTSGANFFKVIPELRRAWAKLLAAAPETVLLLYPFGPAWTNTYPAGTFITCFQQEIGAQGVDPKRLILLQPMESPSDVPKVMAITDVYLDSFPYTGATSLLDPLEAGVPPVTMTGDRLRFAQGEALLRELGMPELIASSEDDYIRIASDLAGDRERRERTRRTVREKMAAAPAFLDNKRFGANAAEVFQQLVRESQNWNRR